MHSTVKDKESIVVKDKDKDKDLIVKDESKITMVCLSCIIIQSGSELYQWFTQHVSLHFSSHNHPNVSIHPTSLSLPNSPTTSTTDPTVSADPMDCKGLFAERDFGTGQIVLEERAFISLASDHNTDSSRGTAFSLMTTTLQIIVNKNI